MYCLKCGKQIEDGIENCPFCGTDQSGSSMKRERIEKKPRVPLKEKLGTALGGIGIVLWYLICLILVTAPIMILSLPWYVELIAFFVIVQFGFIGGLVQFALYVWAFTVAINGPTDGLAIVFYCCAAIYLIVSVIPAIISFIGVFADSN